MKKELTNRRYFLYSTLSSELKDVYYKEVFRFVSRLVFEYHGFRAWFRALFTKGSELNADREIIICEVDFKLAAIAILKNNEIEKKICTFRVAREYQRQGIGKELMELSFEFLGTDYPMITLHKHKLAQFSNLLQYYDFKLEQTQRHYYNVFNTELVYNGMLPEKKLFFNQIEIIDMKQLYDYFLLTGNKDFSEYVNQCIAYWHGKEMMRRKLLLQV